MNKTFKIVVMVVMAVILVVAVLGYTVYRKQATVTAIAEPYVVKVIPEITKDYDPSVFKSHLAHELLGELTDDKIKSLLDWFQRSLGNLVSIDTPQFVNLTVHTNTPTSITYQVSAKFEKGDAVITIMVQLQEKSGDLRIWGFHINSDAFMNN